MKYRIAKCFIGVIVLVVFLKTITGAYTLGYLEGQDNYKRCNKKGGYCNYYSSYKGLKKESLEGTGFKLENSFVMVFRILKEVY